MEKSIFEMVGGEKHITPHYDIKAENTSCYIGSEEENEQLKIKIKALESANKAMVKEIDDMSSGGIGILSKITKLEEEKCELLGLIQAKDKLIKKMKSCGNCKWCSNQCCIENFENPISYRGCENYSKWELAE